ncbi:MAG: glycosyltransferase [Leptolyngbyaceae cyanobacterium CSU_1_3]|nr:glycosyltransferase [Leptolyngbyaceae cyanobacterium CSU_1_3]
MFSPIKLIDIEISQPIPTVDGLTDYGWLQGLVRLHGVPIGWVTLAIVNHQCSADVIRQQILEQYRDQIYQQLLCNQLITGLPQKLQVEDCLNLPAPEYQGILPRVTVAICSRDRPSDLKNCLESLCQLDYPDLDLLVIDNAPSSDATQDLVQNYPTVRYVREPRPGRDWASNRAILEAQGDVIAYTDDDTVVDRHWVKALAQVFAENPDVMAVTGLVVPSELETDAQILFERNGGFGRGFRRQWWRVGRGQTMHWTQMGTGNLGTGANMAYRRNVFEKIGYFDPALDVGTVTNGAGDLEMFFRVLKEGHTLVYEPRSLVRHRHRRDYAQLRKQLAHNGSVYAFWVRSAIVYPETTLPLIRLGLSWLWSGHVRPLITSLFSPSRFPRDLIVAQLWGCLTSLDTYPKSQKIAAEIAETYGDHRLPRGSVAATIAECADQITTDKIAVRSLDVAHPLVPLTDVTDAAKVRVFVMHQGSPVGFVEIDNDYQPISVMRLATAIAEKLTGKLVTFDRPEILTVLDPAPSVQLPITVQLPISQSVSIVIGTYDRPQDLRQCLQGLVAQKSPRSLEILVVDNHPTSGLTAQIAAEFPTVRLICEPRQGVAYARNAGILASQGDIIVTIDDDVSLPADWLEKLIAPLARADVMAVTGNILPLELNTQSQQIFEQYGNGGLGRGFERFEVNGDWFERSWMYAVPTWELGGTANAAFRGSIFRDPTIGLMDEALGPGMPSGVGEDIYLFYKILKAGHTIVYEATAYVWHTHRRDMPALRRQLYNYSKGFVAYHLTTILHDRDFRPISTLLIFLPLHYLKRFLLWLKGDRFYPLSLMALEILGNLAGPWSLARSYQRVSRDGRFSTTFKPQSTLKPS